ncbi:MAG: DEAD/DEAH box helicase [Deltaproteobacteria bacterium]|nr:DEAD/DEAH box helicase [Deltaproteobacteria bacterium]
MLSFSDVVRALTAPVLQPDGTTRPFRPAPDAQQRQAVEAPAAEPLFIVAGPGTGKTASLTLRILKLILVDGIPPRGILATTFTKKAAEELRSRILGWGFRVLEALRVDPVLSPQQRAFVAGLDINQVLTGTIDSLAEQLLRLHRPPGTQPPILVDDFVSKTIMLREGLFGGGRYQDTDLDAFLLDIHAPNGSRFGYHIGAKAALLQQLWERRHQDQVAWSQFGTAGPASQLPGRQHVIDAHAAYAASLGKKLMVDFSTLEHELLLRLRSGQMGEFTDELRVVLVDEYQDTNLMQEQIYFELSKACGGALCVVGDDDQSLYRFRGATVDLFRDFATRYRSVFGKAPQTVFLTNNYRSTSEITSFVNGYATLDAGYQSVRVAGKPPLQAPMNRKGVPILGMFRPSIDDLAADLARFLHAVFHGKGRTVPGGRIERDATRGAIGDCALLCSSPMEHGASGKERLPLLLRQELESLSPPIRVFNPRGEDLATVAICEIFGGLLAECLDPGGVIEGQTSGILRDQTTGQHRVLSRWRQRGIAFAQGASAPAGLLAFTQGWANRAPIGPGHVWPPRATAIELIYALVHFLPELHDDPEGQVYLEAFTRQLQAAAQVGKFGGVVITDPANAALSDASVKELLRDFLAPLADGLVDVDEELIGSFPRDRLSILSIHQSKGLEFPLTIVDVGSDFKDKRAPQFKRFPKEGGPPHRLEDLMRVHSPLGVPKRPQVHRAFDDLFRQYFVAFSRPQDVLLLVGVDPTAPSGRVENVATGWDRTGAKRWAGANCPIVMI